jgi:superoxide dismutase, Cu-Zn family
MRAALSTAAGLIPTFSNCTFITGSAARARHELMPGDRCLTIYLIGGEETMKELWARASMLVLCGAAAAQAATATATVNRIDESGVSAAIGTLRLEDSAKGLVITPNLAGLPPGNHGFHVHANGNCGPGQQNDKMVAGLAAGGHFDPMKTGKHLGPESTEGHEGDLPVLVVDSAGNASQPVIAPHLKVDDVKGLAIVIHAGGDNYSDNPAPLGGGGARIACGIVK